MFIEKLKSVLHRWSAPTADAVTLIDIETAVQEKLQSSQGEFMREILVPIREEFTRATEAAISAKAEHEAATARLSQVTEHYRILVNCGVIAAKTKYDFFRSRN